ncbi:hypothetical protein DZG01_20150 [Pseudomonas fluorescens]|nr:hypothetical protein DZG01_20150 [Pseudomonas fluorescens]
MWRGSLLPLGRVAVVRFETALPLIGAASQPSGSKLPRHKSTSSHYFRPSRFAIRPRFARSRPSSRAALAQLCW